jgi:hypothetical protein
MSEHLKATGSRAEVFHGSAKHTSGGLTKKDLLKNKHGRIVSRRKVAAGKKSIKHLFAMGFKPKKGKFSLFRKTGKKSTKKSMKKSRKTRRRGGADMDASGNSMADAMMDAFRGSK